MWHDIVMIWVVTPVIFIAILVILFVLLAAKTFWLNILGLVLIGIVFGAASVVDTSSGG